MTLPALTEQDAKALARSLRNVGYVQDQTDRDVWRRGRREYSFVEAVREAIEADDTPVFMRPRIWALGGSIAALLASNQDAVIALTKATSLREAIALVVTLAGAYAASRVRNRDPRALPPGSEKGD